MNIGLFYRDYTGGGGMPLEYRCLVAELEKLGHHIIIYCYGSNYEVRSESDNILIKQYEKKRGKVKGLPFGGPSSSWTIARCCSSIERWYCCNVATLV